MFVLLLFVVNNNNNNTFVQITCTDDRAQQII